jgi:hypothetical protein
MSLTELRDNVAVDAAHHHADVIYDPASTLYNLSFRIIPMQTLIDEQEKDVVGLTIDYTEHGHRAHMFTRWSRQQLLAFFGTREKWFGFVGLEREAEELNARASGLAGYRIRTMRPFDDSFPVHIVRGLVSAEYADIPNTNIMEAIVQKMPSEACALRHYSGITDKAFYAYVFSPEVIGIPGTAFLAHPGALVRNSEVGYTSLSITPMLVTAQGQPIVVKEHVLLRRVHRGRNLDLPDVFEHAFGRCSVLWQDMGRKILTLTSKKYASIDEAVATMERLLIRAEAKKEFVAACSARYRTARAKPGHTALDIVENITEVCMEHTDRDENYELSSIAGAVLFRLILT